MDTTIPGMATDPALDPAMAGGAAGGPAANPPASGSAHDSVPKFSGLRGGKARADGLVPGSKEAAAADREKERVRKAAQRSKRRADPPALPSMAAGGDTAVPVAGGPVAGGPVVDAPAVPWQAETLKPVFDQLLPTLERLSVNQLSDRAVKAKLPPELIREIEQDAKWAAPAMKALEIGCPQLAAKYLNKTGVSAEYQPEVVVGTALATILSGHTLLLAKLDKFIASQQPKPEPEKPAKA